jgi:MFS family permease
VRHPCAAGAPRPHYGWVTSTEPDPRRWRALAVTLGAGFMSLLDVSIVNVALPSMQTGLHASAGGVQWVVSGYALAFGLTLVAGGRLGDALGRRRIFMVALTGFVAMSALAGAATTMTWLVGARFLQGLFAGLLTPQSSGIIQNLFKGPERGRAFGLLGATIGVSTAVGPILGGLIIAGFGADTGWRWVFYVNVPIGAVALFFAARLLPGEDKRKIDVKREIDFLGFLFVRWEHHTVKHGRAPLLDVRLFTSTDGYASGATIGMVYFCGFAGMFVVLAMFFQSGLHYTALESGLAVTPYAIGSSVSAAVAGRLVSKWGRRITVGALSLTIFGFALAAVAGLLAPAGSAGLWMAVPFLLAGIGGGGVISPNVTLTLENVPDQMAGAAGGALQTGQRIGTALGAALLVAAYHQGADARDPEVGLVVAIGVAVVVMGVALALAVREYRVRRTCSVDEKLSHHTVISGQ